MIDAKSMFSDLHELLWVCPEAEDIAERLITKLILKTMSVKEFKLHFREVLTKVTRQFVESVSATEDSDNFAPYRNAWYDVARYQTDPIDAALLWGVDRNVVLMMLEASPVPETAKERHKLDVPHAVKKMRENPEGCPAVLDNSLQVKKQTVTVHTQLIVDSKDRTKIPWVVKHV